MDISSRPLLTAHGAVRGLLFELPGVAADVPQGGRLEVVAGDFFSDPLPVCDAYVLMNVIHDWDDKEAIAILSAVADAGRSAASTVLIIETVMPDGPEAHRAKTLDLVMLAITGGRERTLPQYGGLLTAAGLDLVRVIPTATSFSILEGRVPPDASRTSPVRWS